MDAELRRLAEAARGFMPPDEGAGAPRRRPRAVTVPRAPFLEVGTYCGKSSVWLGAAARRAGDGAVRRRPPPRLGGEPAGLGVARARPRRPRRRQDGHAAVLPAHDPRRRPRGRRSSPSSATRRPSPRPGPPRWPSLFIDGGHGDEPARRDYELWTPHVAPGGTLCIHDVFPDPADGGRPPYEEIYLPALESRPLRRAAAVGSLRVLTVD